MAAATILPINKATQDAFISYYGNVQSIETQTCANRRTQYEMIDKQYQREANLTDEHLKAKAANRLGQAHKYQDMTIPIVKPQVQSAVNHQASVFLTGHPLFKVVSAPQYIDAAMQMEALIEDQSVRGGWAEQLLLFFRNGFKYNFAPIEAYWDSEVTPTVETDLSRSLTEGVAKEVIWSGNMLSAWDPYNTFVDRSVSPCKVFKDGEYAGTTLLMSRIRLKQFIARLPDKIISNIRPAFESSMGAMGATNSASFQYYIPTINPDVSELDNKRYGTNWLSWLSGVNTDKERAIKYQQAYEVTKLYCKVLPSEFGIKTPNSNTPQIFKLFIVNHQHIIYCERQTNVHGWIPVFIGQPTDDGLSYQTKSLAEDGIPFQELATAHMSASIAAKRRAIGDRSLYDPSRVTKADINSTDPTAKIPVRPSAYGKQVSDAVYPFPFRDDQSAQSMQQISAIIEMANLLSGQIRVTQGQFQKGNKTMHEFETVMQNSSGTDQVTSILLEHQVFMPMKTVIKINNLQYQGGTTIYNREKDQVVEIDPIALRNAVMEFKVADGLVPSDKLLNSESFTVAMQAFSSSPQIASAYNIAPAFSYFMKTQGAEIAAFEKSQEQQAYEQALGQWQQLMALAIEKGFDPENASAQFPPQPLPEQYGYNPASNTPSPQADKQEQVQPQTGM